VPFVVQLKIEQSVITTLPILTILNISVTPSRGGGNSKIEFRFFLAIVRSLNGFVLKLHGHYVAGLESVQASILR